MNGFEAIEATLKRSAAALRGAEIPFLLGGSLASWARGGPETRHDLDLIIRRDDVDRALSALEAAGMKSERPPEEWLVKAWDGEVLVDLIFHPMGMGVDDDLFARADDMAVLGMDMKVMSLEDMLVTKLLAITEHDLRYETPLAIARALREQIDWEHVRERTKGSPYARAFMYLLCELGIVDGGAERPRRPVDVRVLTRAGSEGVAAG